jgi:hypothetical protein
MGERLRRGLGWGCVCVCGGEWAVWVAGPAGEESLGWAMGEADAGRGHAGPKQRVGEGWGSWAAGAARRRRRSFLSSFLFSLSLYLKSYSSVVLELNGCTPCFSINQHQLKLP